MKKEIMNLFVPTEAEQCFKLNELFELRSWGLDELGMAYPLTNQPLVRCHVELVMLQVNGHEPAERKDIHEGDYPAVAQAIDTAMRDMLADYAERMRRDFLSGYVR